MNIKLSNSNFMGNRVPHERAERALRRINDNRLKNNILIDTEKFPIDKLQSRYKSKGFFETRGNLAKKGFSKKLRVLKMKVSEVLSNLK